MSYFFFWWVDFFSLVQGQRVTPKGQGDEWDWGTWCEIHKESIKKGKFIVMYLFERRLVSFIIPKLYPFVCARNKKQGTADQVPSL